MKRTFFGIIATLLAIGTTGTLHGRGVTSVAALSPTPVAHWSLEAERAIVPPPAGNGNKWYPSAHACHSSAVVETLAA